MKDKVASQHLFQHACARLHISPGSPSFGSHKTMTPVSQSDALTQQGATVNNQRIIQPRNPLPVTCKLEEIKEEIKQTGTTDI